MRATAKCNLLLGKAEICLALTLSGLEFYARAGFSLIQSTR